MNPVSPTNATTSDRLTTVLSYGVLLLLFYLVFRIYEPFLAALGWAAILVIFFYPMQRWLVRRFSASQAAIFSTLAVTILLIAPAILVTTLFVREAVSISRGMQHSIVVEHAPIVAKSWVWIAQRVPGLDPNANVLQMLEQGVEKQAGFLAERLGTVLRNIAEFIFDLFVMIFAMFYFFRDADQIIRGVRSILPFDPEHRETMITQAQNLISASVITSLIIAAIQGTLGGCAGVSTVVDNVVRPILLGGRTELSGLVIFISVVGGVGLFGMLGLVLGPILVATAAGVLAVYMERPASPPITAG